MSGRASITTLARHEGSTVRLGVVGELDLLTGPQLGSVVGRCLDWRPARLATDVSAVSFCDAAGLTALVSAREASLQAGTHFVLTGIRPTLRRLLAVTSLEGAFDIERQHGAISPGSAP
ncbi:STAS domain-containing protein [Streptomyces massasporeus]